MSEWQPIETAPKDGTRILLMERDGHVRDGYWDRVDGWPSGLGWYLWMPLPAPPKEDK